VLLLLIPNPYLRLQNRRFGRARIFKSQIPFIDAGFQTTLIGYLRIPRAERQSDFTGT
jgi:hypothetical protein